MRRLDLLSLVAGTAIATLGVLLLLDASDEIDLSLAAFGPLACAAVGAILVTSGLSRRR